MTFRKCINIPVIIGPDAKKDMKKRVIDNFLDLYNDFTKCAATT